MNIGSLYNASSMFQSMYNTNNHGSSSMASLTSSILGGSSSTSGVYSALSDRALIRSGSYGKLLGAYYDKYGDEDVKKNTSTDILDKLKASTAKEPTDKTVAETEDGKVVEKTEASEKKENATADTASKSTDVLSDIMRRNRTISYTNMGGVVKNMTAPSFDYIV